MTSFTYGKLELWNCLQFPWWQPE